MSDADPRIWEAACNVLARQRDEARDRIAALEDELSRADLTETQLHAALEREAALVAWASVACAGLRNPHMVHGHKIADECPVQPADKEPTHDDR